MGESIGFFIAFTIMELIVGLPIYYILRAITKRKNIEAIALVACIVAVGSGWLAGYRFTKDVMISEYLMHTQRNEITIHGVNLTQEKWAALRNSFISNPDNTQLFHVGAAKASLPSSVFVAIILFWIAERQKKKNGSNNESANT